MSQLGNATAVTIVNTDTLALIDRANTIVNACTGTNCNVSESTRREITQQLSTLSQQQTNATLTLLSIPSTSVLARNINDSYLNLSAAVSSVYNFQCGDNTMNATNCVTNASSVQVAQNNLESLLIQPATNETNHILVLSILFGITILTIFLFFIFLIVGMIETYPPETVPIQILQQPNIKIIRNDTLSVPPVPTNISFVKSNNPPVSTVTKLLPSKTQNIAIPVSPFDSTNLNYS
jgi:hypothetical protein